MASLQQLQNKSNSVSGVRTIRRICYICKTTFVPEPKNDTEQVESDHEDDETPTPVNRLIPIVKQGLKQLCSHYHLDYETVLKQSLEPQEKALVENNFPVDEAFCLPCLRHLAHVGRMSEDLETLALTRLTKVEGLGQLMTLTRKRHRDPNLVGPASKKKRMHEDANDDSDGDSLYGEDNSWATFRKEVVKNYIETCGYPNILIEPQNQGDIVELDLTSSSDSDDTSGNPDSCSGSESDEEAARNPESSGYQSGSDDSITDQVLNLENIKSSHLEKAQELRNHFKEVEGRLVCGKCSAWITLRKISSRDNAETKMLMHIFNHHFPEFHSL